LSVSWEADVAALRADHLAPSSALAMRAAALLQQVAAEAAPELADAARAVAVAQPAMAALVNVANVALRAAEALGVGSVPAALAALQRGIDADRKAAAQALCEHVRAPVRVVTTSASANVVEALQALRRQDLVTGVVCSESRPLLEGTALARWLADQGFATTLVTDASLAEHLAPGAVFVVGTDAILPHGIVNKRGTRLFAAWARLASVPRYVLATRDKIYPPALAGGFANPMRRPPSSSKTRLPVSSSTIAPSTCRRARCGPRFWSARRRSTKPNRAAITGWRRGCARFSTGLGHRPGLACDRACGGVD
jgi:translation initiation factor 2B subunit (eIF-2B alpha/beta/delta family)